MMPLPNILYESERLVFTEFQVGQDEQFSIDLFNEPLCQKYIGLFKLETHEQAADWIRKSPNKTYQENGYSMLKVSRKSDMAAVGTCGLVKRRPEHDEDVNLGYAFMEKYHGNGYATEAAKATVKHAYEKLNVKRLGANVQNDNEASIKILKNIGFKYTRTIEIEDCRKPLDVFALEDTSIFSKQQ